MTDNKPLHYEPISCITLKIIMAILSLLAALEARDALHQAIQMVSPQDASKKFIYTLFLAVLVLFLTILAAFMVQERVPI